MQILTLVLMGLLVVGAIFHPKPEPQGPNSSVGVTGSPRGPEGPCDTKESCEVRP